MPRVKVPERLQELAAELEFVDEAETILSGNVPSLLAEQRKYGIRLALSPQNLGRLDLETEMEDGDDA